MWKTKIGISIIGTVWTALANGTTDEGSCRTARTIEDMSAEIIEHRAKQNELIPKCDPASALCLLAVSERRDSLIKTSFVNLDFIENQRKTDEACGTYSVALLLATAEMARISLIELDRRYPEIANMDRLDEN